MPLYPEGAELGIDEAIGLVADLNSDWRTSVFIEHNVGMFGYPADLKGTEVGPDR